MGRQKLAQLVKVLTLLKFKLQACVKAQNIALPLGMEHDSP